MYCCWKKNYTAMKYVPIIYGEGENKIGKLEILFKYLAGSSLYIAISSAVRLPYNPET